MSNLLIPFGLDKITHSLVEPEDALQGRSCGCICPGCKAPLLSRHPKAGRIHFAHDSKHPEAKPKDECPFSSLVAVAMMVRYLAPTLVGKTFHTPSYHLKPRGNDKPIVVANETSIIIESAKANVAIHSVDFDLQLVIKNHPIYVYLNYKGRSLSEESINRLKSSNEAVIFLNCDWFSNKVLVKNHQLRFSDAVLAFVLNVDHKHWVVHPREKKVIQSTKLASSKVSKVDQFGLSKKGTFNPKPKLLRDSLLNRPKLSKAISHYYCAQCRYKWPSNPSEKLRCPKCHTLKIINVL